jgi:hypothetical protein
MKAKEAKLLQILGAVSQSIIQIDQRTTSWPIKECKQLRADILRAGSTDEIGVHFIGSVVHIDEGLAEAITTSFVHITAMADLQHQHHQFMVHDAADDAIITHAIAPQPSEVGTQATAPFAWIRGFQHQAVQIAQDRLGLAGIELPELSLRRLREP